jgi:hypothetical protein
MLDLAPKHLAKFAVHAINSQGEQMKKLILTSQSNFSEIRQQGGVYVDKTKEIYDCIGTDTYYFLSRPRRFGKSLLCSTLKEMFSGNRNLFKGLWLDSSDWGWIKHPVIHLNMTDMAGERNTAAGVEEKLRVRLNIIAEEYSVELSKSSIIDLVFTLLVESLHKKTGLKVVIIVDEYDKPILDLLSKPEEQKEVHSVLRSFYGTFKALETSLRFVFLTGVYKFTQTSIFSNLNNLNDLTFSPKAGTLLGYTQDEVESYFSEEIEALGESLGLNRNQTLERLREQYNGYRFGVNVNTSELSPGVYNPFGMNHTFASNQMLEKWFTSGSPTFLIKKIEAGVFAAIGPEGLEVIFGDLQNSCNPDAITATSLLYYAGYATMREFDPHTRLVRLGYPNLEVSQATSKELISLFRGGEISTMYKLAIKIADSFRQHRLNDLKELFNQALAQLTYQIIISQEKYFQTVILLLIHMGKLQANAEIPTNDGRMDIVIETSGEIFIVEIKFNKPAAEGLQQIKDKDYAKKFRAKGLKLTAVGLSVSLEHGTSTKNCIFDLAAEQL